ncbi:MAG: hypothetical protein ACYDBJ_05870 [Aggregatilineales bacterium]
MSASTSNRRLTLLSQYLFAGACFIVAAVLITLFLRNIPFDIDGSLFGIDWQHIWHSLQNGHIQFDDWLRIAPWSVLVVLPLGFLSLRDSWAILTLLTLCVLILSVPRVRKSKWRFWLGMLLLVTSYVNLRELVDGNFEGLVIAGVLVFLYGYDHQDVLIAAAGALLMVTKPQDTWVLCLAAGWLMWKKWPRAKLMKCGLAVLAIVIPSMLWFGPAWIAAIAPLTNRDSTNISLKAITVQLNLSSIWLIPAWVIVCGVTVWVIVRGKPTLGRIKTGFLMCASLMLAPYAEGNSFVTVLAIGIIPLFLTRPWHGVLPVVLADLPFIIAPLTLLLHGQYYWLPLFLVTWVILGCAAYYSERHPEGDTLEQSMAGPPTESAVITAPS